MALLRALSTSVALAVVASQTWRNVTLSTGSTLSILFAGAVIGEGEERIVLFLHGFPEGAYMWFPVMSSGVFPESFALVAPDQRGYNRSVAAGGETDASLSLPLLAGDVLALIDVLGGKVDLVAHDFGGGVAWWVAAAAPEKLSSLSIVNMAHPLGWILGVRSVPAQQQASSYVLSFIGPDFSSYLTNDDCAELQSWFELEPFWPGLKDSLLSSWHVPASIDRGLGWYRENIHPVAPLNCTDWTCWQQGVSGAFDRMPANGTVLIPTLVLWGMKDSAFATQFQLDFMSTKVANLSIIEFPDNSHWLAQEAPLEVAMDIVKFITAS
jgi:pimeloyl-ACP methyl ester carboxylesterase